MNPEDLVEMVTSEFLLSIQVKVSPAVSSCKAELQQVLPDHHILNLSLGHEKGSFLRGYLLGA